MNINPQFIRAPLAAPPIATDSRSPSIQFTFAVLGDTQHFKAGRENGSYQKAVREIQSLPISFVMITGDLVGSCEGDCDKRLTAWQSELGDLKGKTYAAMGNHDRTGGDVSDESWKRVFEHPVNGPTGYEEITYSFEFGNSLFVVLASDKPQENLINDIQRFWLDKVLTENQKENIFVFFHEPAFPSSSKTDSALDTYPSQRDALWEMIDKHNVTAVFSGHEHVHSRKKISANIFPGAKNDVYQFIVGNTDAFDHNKPSDGSVEYSFQGNNFLTVDINGKTITVNVYEVDGNLLNSFSFQD